MNEQEALSFGSLVPTASAVFIFVLLAGMIVLRWTRFGRNAYAVGGAEHSARLLGVPVGRTTIGVYALSGACAALAGVVHTIATFSGNGSNGMMWELDAIAAVVIGGTLLTGGVGGLSGTFLGIMIFGIIETAIRMDGRLNSWWTRIAVGVLLLGFILMQRALIREPKK
jgi:simple sugar transport system permease protein